MSIGGGFATVSHVGSRSPLTIAQVMVPAARGGLVYCRQDHSPLANESGWFSASSIEPNSRDSGVNYSVPSLIENTSTSPHVLQMATLRTSYPSGIGVAGLGFYTKQRNDQWNSLVITGTGQLQPEDFLVSNPAVIQTRSGALELVCPTVSGRLRHFTSSDPLGTRWRENSQFGSGDSTKSIALIQHALPPYPLLLMAAYSDRLDMYVYNLGMWSDGRTIWTPPAGLTLVRAPSVYQERVLHFSFRPFPHWFWSGGDFLVAVALSDGTMSTVQILRLSYKAPTTPTATCTTEGAAIQPSTPALSTEVEAVALVEHPPSRFSILTWFAQPSLDLYCWWGNVTQRYTQSDTNWLLVNEIIPTAEIPVLPPH